MDSVNSPQMDSVLVMLAITLLAPFAGALLAGLLRGRISNFIAVLASGAALGASIFAALAVYPSAPFRHNISSLPWLTKVPLFGLALDSLGSLMLLGVTLVGFLVVVYSTEYLAPRGEGEAALAGRERYFFWLLLFLGSMVGVALSPNLLQMFIFWEMNGLCSWALISHTQEEKALRAGFKALVMTHIGGLGFLFALLLVFIFTGSFDFEALGQLGIGLKVGAFFLLLVAAWAKCAQIPFHTWLPDAAAPTTSLSAYLPALALAKPGVYLIARLLVSGQQLPAYISLVIAIMALATMAMATLVYLREDDLNRLLAYLMIAHLGYVFLGLSLGMAGSGEAYRGAVLYILCDAAAKVTLLLCIASIAYATSTRRISQLHGLSGKMPVEAVAYLIGILAATGIPPFSGFWPKFMIFVGALQAPAGWIVLLLLATESVISFGWLLWVGQKIFLGQPSEVAEAAGDPPPAMTVALVAGMLLCLGMPLIGIPLVNAIIR